MSARINARIDDDLARKLERVQRVTGKSASTILKQALQQYLDTVEHATLSPGEALLRSDFVGCGSGEPSLSTDYKKALTEFIARKL